MRDRRTGSGRKGQALVEFALVIPVLLILLLGIVEFGLLMYNQQVITNASREGARFGIVVRPLSEGRRTLADIEPVVDAYAENRMITFGSGPPPTTAMLITDKDTEEVKSLGEVRFGDNLTVTVTFHYDFLVLPNFLAFLVGGSTLQARTTMKYE